MSDCASCKVPTRGFILIANDGVCNDCKAGQDKASLAKITLNAYEDLQLRRRLSKSRRVL